MRCAGIMNRKTLSDRSTGCQGFTFAEVLVVVLISSFLIGGIYTILIAGKNSWELNRDRLELQQQLRTGLDWMRKDLRQAGVSTVSGVATDSAWHTSATFQTPSGVSSGSVTWGAAIQYHLGGTGNTQLLRSVGAQDRVIAQSINLLQFKRTASDPSLIQISAQAQKNTPQHGLITIAVTTQERMRN